MSKYSGKDVVVRFGTLDISGQGRQLEINESADEIDASTYGSTDREYIVGMNERTGSMEILDDDTSSTVRSALALGTSNSLTWFPVGTTAGKPKLSCAVVNVRGRDLSYPYDDVVAISVDLRLSGPVVEGVAP